MTDVDYEVRVISHLYAPWDESPDEFLESVQERVDCTGVLVGVVNMPRPKSDEIMVAAGLKPEVVEKWISSGFKKDVLVKNAMRQGFANGTAAQSAWSGAGLKNSAVISCHMAPDSISDRRWWVVTVVRDSGAFDEAETEAIALMVRRWMSHFNRPRESDMARLIVGHDDRLIHADPNGEQMLLDYEVQVPRMMQDLRDTVEQRWPEIQDGDEHDIALEISEAPWWIRFRRQRALSGDSASYWYVEVRPLDEDELTPCGVVADDRIAEALAYMHDHYNESPSLTEVSMAVHVSPFHFHRLFSKQVGTTPKQYVLQKQIQMAKWMLRAKHMPIAQIADETGFASHGHFTSTFRRFVGVSPSQYRNYEQE